MNESALRDVEAAAIGQQVLVFRISMCHCFECQRRTDALLHDREGRSPPARTYSIDAAGVAKTKST